MATGIRRYCGIAEESTYGQNPAPDAVVHLDIASSTLDAASDPNIIYGGGARRTARISRPGFYSCGGNVVYGLDIRTIGWLLKWAMGQYKFTFEGGTGDKHLHEIYGTEQTLLPSFCSRIGKDLFEHVFSGCVINSLEINVGDALCMATADITAQKDAKNALQAGELLFPAEYPLAFHEAQVYLVGEGAMGGDLDIRERVKEFTLTINNNAAADQGRHVGSRFPARIPVNERETTMSLTLFHEGTDFLEKFWGGAAGPSACGSSNWGLKLVLDSAPCAEHGSLEILIPKVVSTSTQQQPSGRDEMDQTVEVRALMHTLTLADASEVEGEMLCSLENDQDEMGESLGT